MQSPTTGISFQHLDVLLFATVGKNFRGNIELQWPRHWHCLGSRMSLVARPEISTKKKQTLQAFLTPYFLRLSSCSVDPGSANAASDGIDAHRVSGFQGWKKLRNVIIFGSWNLSGLFKKSLKWWKCLVSLLLICVTTLYVSDKTRN